MQSIIRRRWSGLGFMTIGAVLALAVMSSVALVSARVNGGDPPADDVVHACVNPNSETLKIVSSAEDCQAPDYALDLNTKGEKGDRGPQGPAGVDGKDGLDGMDGLPGADGAPGTKGDKGDPGTNGQDGATGPVGPQGPQGPAGSGSLVGSPCTLGGGSGSGTVGMTTAANGTITLTCLSGPTIVSVTTSPSSVDIGTTSLVTVTLNQPAPAGTTASLAVSGAIIKSGDLSLPFATNATTASFSVTGFTEGNGEVDVTLGGQTIKGFVQVTEPLALVAVDLPETVPVGGTITGVIILNHSPGSSASVGISADPPGVVDVPASGVPVLPGPPFTTFQVTGLALGETAVVNFSFNGVTITKNVMVVPQPSPTAIPGLQSLNCFLPPSPEVGTCAVTLDGPAPAGGMEIGLATAPSNIVSLPASVTIPSGNSQATFSLPAPEIDTAFTVTASVAGVGTLSTVVQP